MTDHEIANRPSTALDYTRAVEVYDAATAEMVRAGFNELKRLVSHHYRSAKAIMTLVEGGTTLTIVEVQTWAIHTDEGQLYGIREGVLRAVEEMEASVSTHWEAMAEDTEEVLALLLRLAPQHFLPSGFIDLTDLPV